LFRPQWLTIYGRPKALVGIYVAQGGCGGWGGAAAADGGSAVGGGPRGDATLPVEFGGAMGIAFVDGMVVPGWRVGG